MEAGLPNGVVNLVSGDGPNAGAPVAGHKDVPVVSFYRLYGRGRIIAEMCAPEFKHCSLEMGGKNIIIVMDDANLEPRGGWRDLGWLRHDRSTLHRGESRGGAQGRL